MNRFDEADSVLEQAVQNFPTDLWASFHYARLPARRGNWVVSLQRWEEFRRRFPNASQWYVGLGEALCELNRFEEADAILAEGKKRLPNDIWLAVQSAKVATRKRDWSEALRRWEQVRARFPNEAHGYLQGGLVLSELGKNEEAELLLSEAVKRAPGDFWVSFQHARICTKAKRWADAAERWHCVRTDFPYEATGYLEEVEALRQLGLFDRAEGTIAECLRNLPENEAIAVASVQIATAKGEWPKVIRQWKHLNERFPPTSAKAYHDRSRLRGAVALSRPEVNKRDFDVERRICGAVISEDPVIILSTSLDTISGSFDVVSAVAKFYEQRPVQFFLCSAFSLVHRTPFRQQYREIYLSLATAFPNLTVTVLANDVKELAVLHQLGIKAELINHNAFIDENIFTISSTEQPYDVVYTASFSPFKRHELAAEIDKSDKLLLVLSHLRGIDSRNVQWIKDAKSLLPRATIANERAGGPHNLSNVELAAELNKAKCGLCLSAQEGAMSASIEYILCGLPVVTTRNVGGRDWFFANDYTVWCDADPIAVRDSVRRIIAAQISREDVRRNGLERVKRERLAFFGLVDQVFHESGQESRRFAQEFGTKFIDRIYYHLRPLPEFFVP